MSTHTFFSLCVPSPVATVVSNLGKEHLFLANWPSDIDAEKHSVKVITFEEVFDHCDTGVGLCLLLPRAYVLRKFVDHCIERDISVHFVFRVRVVPASLKLLQRLFFGGAALAVPMPVAVPSRSRIDSINGVQEEIPSCLAVF